MESSGSWEVEAQQSLPTETRGLLLFCEDDDEHTAETRRRRGVVARQALLRATLLLRCTRKFKLAAAKNYDQNRIKLCTPSEITVAADEHPAETRIRRGVVGRQALLRATLLLRCTQRFKLVAKNYNHQEADSNGNGISISESAASSSDGQSVTLNIEELQQRKSIVEIVRNKNLPDLRSFGGVQGVAVALNTHLENGISSIPDRQTLHFHHHLYKLLVNILLRSLLKAANNKIIFLLSIDGILSLAFGVIEDGMHDGFGWLNGAVLISSVFLIIIVTGTHNFWKEWTSNLWVLTVRGGKNYHLIGETDVVVGDIVILRKGDRVPGDGLFVISTTAGDDDQPLELNDGSTVDENNPFLFYGTRVINGNAKMLVTSTRADTVWGEMMSLAIFEESNCTLESFIYNLYKHLLMWCLVISTLSIIAMFVRYEAAGKMDDERKYRPDPKGEPARVITITYAIMGIVGGKKGTTLVFTTLLSVTFLGVTDGVPVVISFATIFWGRKTLEGHKATASDNLAFLKMASVTTIICTDVFGGLTEQDEYKIEKFIVGEDIVSESSVVASQVLQGLCDGITATQLLIPHTDALVPVVISWAEANLGLKTASVIGKFKMRSHGGRNPFQERCQVLVEKNENVKYLHFSGPPRDILPLCSHHYDINGERVEIDERKRSIMLEGILHSADQEARVIAYACTRVVVGQDPQLNDDDDDDDLIILLAIIILKEVKIEETKEAVSAMLGGGVRTIIASGDDISVLEPIGRNCGLIAAAAASEEDHLAVITGQEFRSWSDEERMEKLGKICILGNCIPSDKILLVKCLRKKGDVVALLAQRTIDAPALKLADIGITFGTRGSQVAREFSDITIWDFDPFGFVLDAIKRGRCFQDNIGKFIQLHLIFTISSTLINFIAVVSSGDAPITPVQLFWLNLVVPLFGGLALLAGPTMKISMVPAAKLIISKAMWRNIAIQASYQTTISLILQHNGQDFLGTSAGCIKSAVYNGFFLCQLFNLLIAREPEKKNIFGGAFRSNNFWFWVAFVIFVTCQGVFAVAERVLGTSPGLNLKLWGACLLTGLFSLLLDWAAKTCIASTFKLSVMMFCANELPTSNALNASDMSV